MNLFYLSEVTIRYSTLTNYTLDRMPSLHFIITYYYISFLEKPKFNNEAFTHWQ